MPAIYIATVFVVMLPLYVVLHIGDHRNIKISEGHAYGPHGCLSPSTLCGPPAQFMLASPLPNHV